MGKREETGFGGTVKRGVTPAGNAYKITKSKSGRTDAYVAQDRSDGSGTLHYKERSSNGKVTKGRTRTGITPGGRLYRADKDNGGSQVTVEGKTTKQTKWKNEHMSAPTKASSPKKSSLLDVKRIKKGFTKPAGKK